MYLKQIDKFLDFEDIKKEINLKPNDVIYIGGSLIEGSINKYAEGMGNIYSDLDIFIIRDEVFFQDTEYTYIDNFVKTDFIEVKDFKIDIEIFNRRIVDELIEAIKNIDFNISTRINNSIILPSAVNEYKVTGFLNRLYNSICIINEIEYESLKNKIKYRNWCDFMKYSLHNSIENSFDDIIGNLHAGIYDVSVLCTRNAFLLFLKYIVFSLGDLIDRDKWVSLKFFNILKYHNEYLDVALLYEELFFCSLPDDESKKSICEKIVTFISFKLEEYSMEELI